MEARWRVLIAIGCSVLLAHAWLQEVPQKLQPGALPISNNVQVIAPHAKPRSPTPRLSGEAMNALEGVIVLGEMPEEMSSFAKRVDPVQLPIDLSHHKELKIFVYELQPHLNLNMRASNVFAGTDWEQTANMEKELHQKMLASPFRTKDPAEATAFFIPAYPTMSMLVDCGIAEVDECKSSKFMSKRLDEYMESLMHVVKINYPFWQTKNGWDHLLPVPPTPDACTRIRTGNPILLTANADTVDPCGQSSRRVVVPTAVDRGEVEITGQVRGPDEYVGQKKWLLHFRGTHAWKEWFHGEIAKQLLSFGGEVFTQPSEGLMRDRATPFNVVQEVVESAFCLCPKDKYGRPYEVVEAILAECVPVIMHADELNLYGGNTLPWDKFAVLMDTSDTDKLYAKLTDAVKRLPEMRAALRKVRQYFVVGDPMMSVLLDELGRVLP